jgi:hypothetical protein
METLIFLRKINVFQRFRSSRWKQVGVIIGVLGGKPDKIETAWLGELNLEEVPRVLGVLVGLRRMSHAVWGVPAAGKVRHHGRPLVLASVLGWSGGKRRGETIK